MRKLIITIIFSLIVFSAIIITTRGFREEAFVDVCLDIEGNPIDKPLAGKTIKISEDVNAEITAVTPLNNLSSSTPKFRIHATIRCNTSLRFSIRNASWEHKFLASTSKTEKTLRDFAGVLPTQKSTMLGSDPDFLP